jgi:hypothetical protein
LVTELVEEESLAKVLCLVMSVADSALPVIDMAFATEQTMGDPAFLSELLHEMLTDEEKKTNELREGLRDNDHVVIFTEYLIYPINPINIETTRSSTLY